MWIMHLEHDEPLLYIHSDIRLSFQSIIAASPFWVRATFLLFMFPLSIQQQAGFAKCQTACLVIKVLLCSILERSC